MPKLDPESQTYIDIGESTANLDYILTVVQRKWGGDIVIVTKNGLILEDSSATQGLFTLHAESIATI